MNPLSTTLNAIREHSPCEGGWKKLLSHLGKTSADDEPLLLETVLMSNGLDDALWCLRSLGHEHQRTCRLFAVWCARQVQHLMTDPRSVAALDVAELHADGKASDSELAAARGAAWGAARGAARGTQKQKFLEICRAGEFVGPTSAAPSVALAA